MSLTPARMKHLDVVVLERDAREVTTLLGRMGVLHLLEVKAEESPAGLSPAASANMEKCRNLLSRLEMVRERLGLTRLPDVAAETHEPLGEVEKQFQEIEKRVMPVLNERTEVDTESESLQDELARLEALGAFSVSMARVLESPFLHFAIGTIKTADLRRLQESRRPNTLLLDEGLSEDRHRLIAVTSRKGRFALETVLKAHNFQHEDLTNTTRESPTDVMAGLHKRLDEIRKAQARISVTLHNLRDELGSEIARLLRRLNLESALLSAAVNFGHTGSTCLIRGWIPEESLPAVTSRILDVTQERALIQVREPSEVGASANDIPVMLRHNRFVRPFQLLVTGFGFPRYTEIEPTLIVAVAFLLMYGLMFGDIGQGAVLAIIGYVVYRRMRVQAYKDLGLIIMYAGCAGVCGGFLYGSLFGKEFEWLPPLWLYPLRDVTTLLAIPLSIGILLMSIGIFFNIVNYFRARQFFRGIVDRCGIVGLIFYWGCLGMALRWYFLGAPITAWQVILFIALPLLALFFRDLFYGFLHKEHAEGTGAAVLSGSVDLMETLSSYLANTISFTRIGAFALAHAGLSMAVFELERGVRDVPAGMFWSILIIVLGNLLILILEGLIVFVQCLRLEYYEFFSKFFGGEGKRYTPFRLR